MKKTVLFSLLITAIYSLFALQELHGQEITQQGPLTKQDYLAKSKRQQTAAWVLLCSGAASMTTGLLISKGEFHSSGDFFTDLFGGGHYENDGIRSTFIGLGFCALTGSIPCFLAAGRNKRKAASLSLKNQRVPVSSRGAWVNRGIPSLQLTVKL